MLSTPLVKPLGAQMRGIHTLAASLEAPRRSATRKDPATPNFVRPDCPPVSDDEESSRGDTSFVWNDRFHTMAYSGEPKFRSTLEQVCS